MAGRALDAVHRLARPLTVLSVVLGAACPSLGASGPVGDTIQVSHTAPERDPTRQATGGSVAYNASANEYLVTWSADGLATDDEFEIFAQRISASGAPLSPVVRISHTGSDGDGRRRAFGGDVAYNARTHEYLVTWSADGLATDDEEEIFAQRVSADGLLVGAAIRVSTTGAEGDATRDATAASVVYDIEANEYLVTWYADGLSTDDEFEIFAQRVGADGTLLGGSVRVSTTGADGDATRDAYGASAAYGARSGEYLVTWTADGLGGDEEFEIFAQRVTRSGRLVGSVIRVSNAGTVNPVGAGLAPIAPSIAYGTQLDQYLITWKPDATHAQRVSAAGTLLGTATRLPNASSSPSGSTVGYGGRADEFLILGAGSAFEPGLTSWISAQRMSSAGTPIGGPVRVGTRYLVLGGSLAYNGLANEFLVTWMADANDGLSTLQKWEIFARRVAGGTTDRGRPALYCAGRVATIVGTAGPDRLVGTAGADVIVAGAGDDRVLGRGGSDRICLGAGNDRVWAGSGNDRVWAGPGDDRVIGETGRDTMFGGAGNDWLSGGAGADRLLGEEGRDRLGGGPGDDRLGGGAGPDLIVGATGRDVLTGGQGNDGLFGDAGRDIVIGGAGRDAAHGGPGQDTCVAEILSSC